MRDIQLSIISIQMIPDLTLADDLFQCLHVKHEWQKHWQTTSQSTLNTTSYGGRRIVRTPMPPTLNFQNQFRKKTLSMVSKTTDFIYLEYGGVVSARWCQCRVVVWLPKTASHIWLILACFPRCTIGGELALQSIIRGPFPPLKLPCKWASQPGRSSTSWILTIHMKHQFVSP